MNKYNSQERRIINNWELIYCDDMMVCKNIIGKLLDSVYNIYDLRKRMFPSNAIMEKSE